MCRLWSALSVAAPVPAVREAHVEDQCTLLGALRHDDEPLRRATAAAPRDDALLLGSSCVRIPGDHLQPVRQRHDRGRRVPRVVEDRGQRRQWLGSFVQRGRPVGGCVGSDVTRRLPATERRGRRRGVHARVADVRVVVRAARRSRKHDRVVVVAMAEAAGDVEVPASRESGGGGGRDARGHPGRAERVVEANAVAQAPATRALTRARRARPCEGRGMPTGVPSGARRSLTFSPSP